MRTEERSFSSAQKWMGVRVRDRTQQPSDVSNCVVCVGGGAHSVLYVRNRSVF